MFFRAGDTINFSLPSTFIQFISSRRVSCMQSLSVSSCCCARFCGWLWLFWSQGIGRDYNEILHWPLEAQVMAFAKMEIRLPGKPSHTHTQTLLHLPVLLVRVSCRSEGKVACEVSLQWPRALECGAVCFGTADIFSKLSSVIIRVGTDPIFWETFAVLHCLESVNCSVIDTLVYFKRVLVDTSSPLSHCEDPELPNAHAATLQVFSQVFFS